ncbi:MAG: LysR family transcriptional regulator [Pseudomonadota bacterium]|nr:LysR family transcriptional regulator [Pseudomonadota bacterium]MEE2863962.1 LysR family transcriptional regulator [Pseudomonadota bacterium]
MMMDNLALFVRIAETGGIASAGREMGYSPATTSERLAALEAHYGVRLLTRSTRALSLTEEGRLLLDGARRLLAEAEELDARIRLGAERLAGPIRLSAPLDLGRTRLRAVLDRFLETHPDVTIDLHLSDGFVDVASQGYDVAIRYGELKDSTLIVRKLAANARIVCAAPSYVERHGRPHHPRDLARHDCLLMRFGSEPDNSWQFLIDGKIVRCPVSGRRTANDGGLVRDWCLAGFGIARKSQWDVAEDLAAGKLVPLLREFELPPAGLQAVYPKGRSEVRRIKALLEELETAFK